MNDEKQTIEEKIKDLLRDIFFKVFNEETFDKNVFIKNLKVGGIALVIGLILGGVINSDTAEIEKLEKQVSDLSEEKSEYVELASERSGIISSRDSKIEELESKVESASPWFEMEEAEQEAEREKIAQKKAEQEAAAQAEEQAKKEEEERKKEEARVASEKAASEKTEKQAEAGGDPLVEEGLKILRENMGDIANISYKKDTSTFLVNPTEDGFKRDLAGVAQGQYLDEWDVLVDGMVRLSYSMRNTLPGKSVALVNPYNEGNHILLLKDGIILYDFTQD